MALPRTSGAFATGQYSSLWELALGSAGVLAAGSSSASRRRPRRPAPGRVVGAYIDSAFGRYGRRAFVAWDPYKG